MNELTLYKIKDSVDLFLSDNRFIMAYFMNTRQRKSFKVNENFLHLIQMIDGENTLAELKKRMRKECDVSEEDVENAINLLSKNRIITEVNQDDSILRDIDIERYTRQINYFSEFLDSDTEGLMAQKKLFDSHVLICGCGAVGGDIALELVMAGVRQITLFDYDIVENADVCRHMYYSADSVGMSKIESLKRRLKEIDSDVQVHIFNRSMKPEDNIENIISKMDFVVNTMDEPYIGYTSAKISRICVKYNIAHYVAGGFDAHLASTGELIIPFLTPCVECYATHFKETLKDWKPQKHPVKHRHKEIGGLASMSLFSASYASIEIIKYLAGLICFEDRYKVRGEFLFNDMSLTYLNVKKNPECPICGGFNKI